MNAKVRAIYGKEMRDMLRDRRTIFAAVIIPLVLYPLMILGMAEVTQYARAKLERDEFNIAVLPGTQPLVEKTLAIARDAPAPEKGIPAPPKSKDKAPEEDDEPDETSLLLGPAKADRFIFRELSPEAARQELADGKIRAILILPADFEAQLAQNKEPTIELQYDRAERVSQTVALKLTALLERYQSHVIAERLREKTLPAGLLRPFTLRSDDLSPPEKLGGSIFGSILPVLFIMMLMTGAMNPAIDMTAGEKERSTLETLVGTPARPLEIVAGKFLAVGTLSLANAVLNVASCTLSLKGLPLGAHVMQMPWSALPLTLLLLVPLACFFSALVLMISCFAATTKEAQMFCLPVLFTPMLAMGVTMTPGIELEGPLLVMPVVNVALLIKEIFIQHGTLQQILFVFMSTSLYAAGMIALAARAFAREEVLFSAQGSLRMFLSRRFYHPAPVPRAGDSLLVAALLFPLYFYLSLYLQKLISGSEKHLDWKMLGVLIAVPLYTLFLALPIGVAKYLKAGLATTFLWRRPPLRAVLGVLLMGATSWILAMQLLALQSRVWPMAGGPDPFENVVKQLNAQSGGTAILLFLIAFTPALCEEHFFRGFLQQGLGRRHKWFTLILVGVIFGFFHVSVYRAPILSFFGTILAYVAWKSRSIWPGAILHFMHNALTLKGPEWSQMPMDEPVISGQVPNIPIPYLVPAVVVFAVGLLLVKSLSDEDSIHDVVHHH